MNWNLIKTMRDEMRKGEMERIVDESLSRFDIRRIKTATGAECDVITLDGHIISEPGDSFRVCDKLAWLREKYIEEETQKRLGDYGKTQTD